LSCSAPPPYHSAFLMYTTSTKALTLYIRNIIPDGLGIPLLGYQALSGWGYALFTQLRLYRILGSSPWIFSFVTVAVALRRR